MIGRKSSTQTSPAATTIAELANAANAVTTSWSAAQVQAQADHNQRYFVFADLLRKNEITAAHTLLKSCQHVDEKTELIRFATTAAGKCSLKESPELDKLLMHGGKWLVRNSSWDSFKELLDVYRNDLGKQQLLIARCVLEQPLFHMLVACDRARVREFLATLQVKTIWTGALDLAISRVKDGTQLLKLARLAAILLDTPNTEVSPMAIELGRKVLAATMSERYRCMSSEVVSELGIMPFLEFPLGTTGGTKCRLKLELRARAAQRLANETGITIFPRNPSDRLAPVLNYVLFMACLGSTEAQRISEALFGAFLHTHEESDDYQRRLLNLYNAFHQLIQLDDGRMLLGKAPLWLLEYLVKMVQLLPRELGRKMATHLIYLANWQQDQAQEALAWTIPMLRLLHEMKRDLGVYALELHYKVYLLQMSQVPTPFHDAITTAVSSRARKLLRRLHFKDLTINDKRVKLVTGTEGSSSVFGNPAIDVVRLVELAILDKESKSTYFEWFSFKWSSQDELFGLVAQLFVDYYKYCKNETLHVEDLLAVIACSNTASWLAQHETDVAELLSKGVSRMHGHDEGGTASFDLHQLMILRALLPSEFLVLRRTCSELMFEAMLIWSGVDSMVVTCIRALALEAHLEFFLQLREAILDFKRKELNYLLSPKGIWIQRLPEEVFQSACELVTRWVPATPTRK